MGYVVCTDSCGFEMTDYDVIVVGAGPAGSTTARRAAQAGLNVLLLDKEPFPRSKPCAGGIRFQVSELLDFDLSSVYQRKISGIAVFSPSGLRADCISEDRSMPGMTVMRNEFDYLLLQKAIEAGTTFMDSTEVIDIHETSNEISVTTLDGEVHTADYVVGADGINSNVAKQLKFYSGWKKDRASVALEAEVEVGEQKVREICGEPSGYDAELLLLYFGEFSHGYTWCFPKKTVLSVGACCRQDKVKNIRAGFMNWFTRFQKDYKFEGKIISERAARFPVKPAETLAKGRALLVGDAAGLVDAFTGEGIPEAIQSGILAAKALHMAVEKSNPLALWEYEQDCQSMILSELKVSQSNAKLFYRSLKNMETLCKFFKEDNYASQLIAKSIGGHLPQGVVKRKLTLHMMRVRPRQALSLYL
jgi:geranylgeranyl reductase family protein